MFGEGKGVAETKPPRGLEGQNVLPLDRLAGVGFAGAELPGSGDGRSRRSNPLTATPWLAFVQLEDGHTVDWRHEKYATTSSADSPSRAAIEVNRFARGARERGACDAGRDRHHLFNLAVEDVPTPRQAHGDLVALGKASRPLSWSMSSSVGFHPKFMETLTPTMERFEDVVVHREISGSISSISHLTTKGDALAAG